MSADPAGSALEVGDFAREKIERTVNELREERDSVRKLELVS